VLYECELERLKEIHAWFNGNLKKPSSLARSSKPGALKRAISWYKDTATEHITKMRELVVILEMHGVYVEVIQTERRGYIVYEDPFQVAAEPFNKTGAYNINNLNQFAPCCAAFEDR
jgi:hypothetical protein